MITFDRAFDRLISHEGGYVNNPKDPGGETKFGISKRSYPDVDIKNLRVEDAKFIYQRDFWDVLSDKIDPAVKFQAFDFAVNSGIQTAIRKLQKAVGVADDGHWGSASVNAVASKNVNDVLMLFIAERLDFWTSLSTWQEFGKGWARRAATNLRYAAEDN